MCPETEWSADYNDESEALQSSFHKYYLLLLMVTNKNM